MPMNHGGRWQVDKFEILYLPACFLENWPKTLLFWDCCALSVGILGNNLCNIYIINICIYTHIYASWQHLAAHAPSLNTLRHYAAGEV